MIHSFTQISMSLFEWNTVVSSVNRINYDSFDAVQISFMYKMKGSGPKMEP